tara:strand:- start:55 stop:897 length:843 start_codon:yes stop_codon:yes gene_type:complete
MDYYEHPAISNSKLNWFARSPYYYKRMCQSPDEPTASMDFGTAFHMYVLEHELFNDNYIIHEKFDRRTKAGKEHYNNMMDLAASGKKKLISDTDLERIKWMHNSLIDNPAALNLLPIGIDRGGMVCMNKDGRVESEIYFNYMGGGLNIGCKSKIDYIQFFSDKYDDTDVNLIDLKTTQSITSFKSSYKYKFGYYRQAAFYRLAALSQGLNVKDFYFVVVETQYPHECAVFKVGQWDMERGTNDVHDLLVSLNTCIEEDHFPMYGHSSDDGIITLNEFCDD